jgi:hypothetical protein
MSSLASVAFALISETDRYFFVYPLLLPVSSVIFSIFLSFTVLTFTCHSLFYFYPLIRSLIPGLMFTPFLSFVSLIYFSSYPFPPDCEERPFPFQPALFLFLLFSFQNLLSFP